MGMGTGLRGRRLGVEWRERALQGNAGQRMAKTHARGPWDTYMVHGTYRCDRCAGLGSG